MTTRTMKMKRMKKNRARAVVEPARMQKSHACHSMIFYCDMFVPDDA